MGDKKNHVARMQELYNRLADSVMELSDEAIIVESSETGTHPLDEAEHVRLVLRQSSKGLNAVERFRDTTACLIRKREASNG
jgi:hypothetical protein